MILTSGSKTVIIDSNLERDTSKSECTIVYAVVVVSHGLFQTTRPCRFEVCLRRSPFPRSCIPRDEIFASAGVVFLQELCLARRYASPGVMPRQEFGLGGPHAAQRLLPCLPYARPSTLGASGRCGGRDEGATARRPNRVGADGRTQAA